jgi:hypothetical protein
MKRGIAFGHGALCRHSAFDESREGPYYFALILGAFWPKRQALTLGGPWGETMGKRWGTYKKAVPAK